jgi:hypothetical protein
MGKPATLSKDFSRSLGKKSDAAEMDTLTRQIQHRLESHKFCTVFEKDLGRVWPYVDREREKRFALIKAYARSRGWSATILDPGIRVTFRKLPNGKSIPSGTERGRRRVR